MPATRPRASFEPIAPDFDLKALVESTSNFSYVDRISCDMIEQQGLPAFEKLILLHVIIGGKPLVIDGFEDRLDPWSFTPKWLRDNCGNKQENARDLTNKVYLPLTMAHYLKNMRMLTDNLLSTPGAYRDGKKQRMYLKDIDCPDVWRDKLREQIPSALFYLNEGTGEIGGLGAVPDPTSTVSGRRLGKGIARAGDLMSSLPPEMRAENLMCYIGHEGTYTPSHREMCASLGQNIMVEASNTVSEDGKAEKPGSSIWFMTESKDRHTVSEYWLSVLGHDIEVENHFAQVVAWKKAPFNVYVVEQRPGDFILIPPLAPHQVWNRGSRTMKVAWNRTTVETLEMALNEALPRSRIVCRDEQYKNKAIIYYTLQKYSGLLTLAQQQASRLPDAAVQQLLYSGKIKQLAKDFRKLFNLYRQILLSEMFNPEDRDTPKSIEYLPFDSNVTCAYCRGNIFNRFLSCPSCKDVLGHNPSEGGEGDPYDVCMDCYAMGRSCACISGLKWTEQFRWKELAAKYEGWRKLIIALDGGQVTEKTPLPILEERKRYGKKTLAEVCKDQLKRRPWKDVSKNAADKADEEKEDDEEEEIVVDDNGMVKKILKKKSKTWLKNNPTCHICCHRQPNWKMAACTACDRWFCYGTLFRGWDKMPIDIMENPDWSCPHCLGICFAGACKREGKMTPYEPKGTLLGHDTRKVADARSVEALVDFSVSNLNWLKEDDPANRAESRRIKRAGAEAQRAKQFDPSLDEVDGADGVEEGRIELEDEPTTPLDPALGGNGLVRMDSTALEDDSAFARRLQQATSSLPPPAAMVAGAPVDAPDGYAPVSHAGYVPPAANMYGDPNASNSYTYPGGYSRLNGDDGDDIGELRPFRKRRRDEEDEDAEGEDIHMTKYSKAKKPRLSAAGFRSSDLASEPVAGSASKAKSEAQRQFEREKERQALEKAKSEGRFIMLQAALKGKRRVVRLPIPGARLAQLLAQQAAKAALTHGEDADAEHEVDEGATQEPTDEAGEDEGMLLKSDIAPKKRSDAKTYYAQRQLDGHLLTGRSKKALIPVEKDENYGYHAPSSKKGKLAVGEDGTRKRKPLGRNGATVEYEEVDIGSDADDDVDADNIFVAGSTRAGATSSKENRRSLPSYLRNRNEEDEDFPDELPAVNRPARPSRPKAAPAITTPKSAPSKSSTAGKRPSMRPHAINGNGAVDSGEYMDVDEVMADRERSERPRVTFAAVNKPAVNGSSSTATPKATQKARMDEQNRLAKLEALEMVTSAAPTMSANRAGQISNSGMVNMADVLDEESEDDGVEEVPAGRSVRV